MSRRSPFILGMKTSKVKVTSHRIIAGVGLCTLLSDCFSYLHTYLLLLAVMPKQFLVFSLVFYRWPRTGSGR